MLCLVVCGPDVTVGGAMGVFAYIVAVAVPLGVCVVLGESALRVTAGNLAFSFAGITAGLSARTGLWLNVFGVAPERFVFFHMGKRSTYSINQSPFQSS